jgi:hypothetical protein
VGGVWAVLDAKTRFLVPWHPAVAATNNSRAGLLLMRVFSPPGHLARPCARCGSLELGDPAVLLVCSFVLQFLPPHVLVFCSKKYPDVFVLFLFCRTLSQREARVCWKRQGAAA